MKHDQITELSTWRDFQIQISQQPGPTQHPSGWLRLEWMDTVRCKRATCVHSALVTASNFRAAGAAITAAGCASILKCIADFQQLGCQACVRCRPKDCKQAGRSFASCVVFAGLAGVASAAAGVQLQVVRVRTFSTAAAAAVVACSVARRVLQVPLPRQHTPFQPLIWLWSQSCCPGLCSRGPLAASGCSAWTGM